MITHSRAGTTPSRSIGRSIRRRGWRITGRRVLAPAAALGLAVSAVLGTGGPVDAHGATGQRGNGPGSGHPSACVSGGSCYSTLGDALAAASPGAVVRLTAGSFSGGVTIRQPVTLIGAGARRTVIAGGGPVITALPSAVQVRIAKLTITGGVTHGDGVNALGGGLYAPPLPNTPPPDGIGATIALTDVNITGNRTEPTSTSPSPSGVKCPESDCPYAGSFGGGVATFGNLTLTRVQITHNLAGGPASDATGAGVWSNGGHLVLRDTNVERNAAVPLQIGRFAEGGGLFVEGGSLDIDRSTVSANRADLRTTWPILGQGELIAMGANAGGIHVGDADSATITRSRINDNLARAVDPAGEPLAFDVALLSHLTPLVMRDTEIRANRIVGVVATSDDILPVGSAVEVNAGATITDTRITGNTVDVYSRDGSAWGSSGLAVYDFVGNQAPNTLRHVFLSRNVVRAVSTNGSAGVIGVGLFNNTVLDVRDSTVNGNVGIARAPQTTAQGGGIWNGVFLSGPPVELTLTGSRVTGNSLSATDPTTAQGGGIYNTESVTLNRSPVIGNRPDDCFGCTTGASGPTARSGAAPAHSPLAWR